MEWMIFLLLSFATAIINNHVGFVGIHYLITLFIFVGAYINVSSLGKILKDAPRDKAVNERKKYNAMLNLWTVASVGSFLLGTVLNVMAFLMTSGITGKGSVMSLTPVVLFDNIDKTNVAIILLIISEALSFVATFLLLRRKNLLQEMVDDDTDEDTPLFKLEYRLDLLTVFSMLAATVVGCLNNYFGLLSVLIHMFYFIIIAMMIMLIGNYNRYYDTAGGKNHKVDFYNGMKKNGRFNRTYVALIWIVTLASVALQLMMAYKFQYEGFAMINFQSTQTMAWCSVVMDVVMSLFLTSTITKIKPCEK